MRWMNQVRGWASQSLTCLLLVLKSIPATTSVLIELVGQPVIGTMPMTGAQRRASAQNLATGPFNSPMAQT
jgi:hypothetical protein